MATVALFKYPNCSAEQSCPTALENTAMPENGNCGKGNLLSIHEITI